MNIYKRRLKTKK